MVAIFSNFSLRIGARRSTQPGSFRERAGKEARRVAKGTKGSSLLFFLQAERERDREQGNERGTRREGRENCVVKFTERRL